EARHRRRTAPPPPLPLRPPLPLPPPFLLRLPHDLLQLAAQQHGLMRLRRRGSMKLRQCGSMMLWHALTLHEQDHGCWPHECTQAYPLAYDNGSGIFA
uniref:Uncharacterized protein n=1 Tax=Triticum urartu TaxID=4572 RepID=A0A8R7PB89_TRIUA